MGCGSSSSNQVSQGQQKNSNSIDLEPIKGIKDTLILYAFPGSNKVTDISQNFPSSVFCQLYDKMYQPSIKQDQISVFKNRAQQLQRTIIIADICSLEGMILTQQFVSQLELEEKKIQFYIIFPTMETCQNLSGIAIAYLNFLVSNYDIPQGVSISYIERQCWYQSGQKASQIVKQLAELTQNIEEKRTVYFPGGVETQLKLDMWIQENVKSLFTLKQAYTHCLQPQYQDDQEIISHILMQSYQNLQQRFEMASLYQEQLKKTVLKVPPVVSKYQNIAIQYNQNSLKQIITQGEFSFKMGKQLQQQSGNECFQLENLNLQVLKQNSNLAQDYIYILDTDQPITQSIYSGYIKEESAIISSEIQHIYVLLLPESQKDWGLILPYIQAGQQNADLVILLNKQNQQDNLQFLLGLTQIQGSLGNVAKHLSPFPGMHFVTPLQLKGKQYQSLFENGRQITLNQESSIFSAVNMSNQNVDINLDNFVKTQEKNEGGDIINNYLFLPQPVFKVNITNNSLQYILVNHALSVINTLDLILANPKDDGSRLDEIYEKEPLDDHCFEIVEDLKNQYEHYLN